MLVPPFSRDMADASSVREPARAPQLSVEFGRLFAAIRRQLPVVVVVCLLSGVLGALYLATLSPRYTSSAFVMIDNRRIRAVENAYDVNSSFDVAASIVDSQVEVVKSAQVAEALVRKLDLTKSPVFQAQLPQPGYLKRLLGDLKDRVLLTQNREQTQVASSHQLTMDRAVSILQSALDVRRVARTMVLQISYTSGDPANAAEMANAYADAYLADQLNAKYEATKRASLWLEERLAELKQKAINADLALQKFRAENNLISTGGKLINEQQLNEANTQLVLARAERARAQARYQRIEAIIRQRETKAVVNEAIGNTQIEQLRSKYLDASKRETELSAKLGRDHLSAVNLRAEMAEYERLMFAELSRVAEGYRSEVDIAKARETTLSENVENLIAVAAKENKSLVTLREIEREGEAFRNLYQAYLQRYQESLQQQTFPIIEARIITPASPPLGASYPQKGVILFLFLMLGGAAGSLLGIYREFREKGFGSEEQVRDDLGVECLGIIPFATVRTSSLRHNGMEQSKKAPPFSKALLTQGPLNQIHRGENQSSGFLLQDNELLVDLIHPERLLDVRQGLMTYVLDRPNSAFTETLLSVKLAADVKLSGLPSKIIGVVSALPGEGKTSFSKNFASLLASLNTRTLLVDADLRKPELTARIAPKATSGLLEAVIGSQSFQNLLWREEASGLNFLPTVSKTRVPHTSELLGSEGMRRLLTEAEDHFDYIVLDLPPFGPVVDVRAIAGHIQAFALVVEWRRTARRIVRTVLSEDERLHEKCLGVVLNKVNINKIKLFEEYGSRYYYFKKYSKSYYTET